MRGMSSFAYYLRTGRRALERRPLELKFNGWHDSEDGRFTFVGQGKYFGSPRAPTIRRSTPAAPTLHPRAHAADNMPQTTTAGRAPPIERKPGPNQDSATPLTKPSAALARINREMRSIRPTLRSIPGFPDAGRSSWRAANDRAFIDAADRFNSLRGLKPGNPKYVDPLLIKAWATVESGGSQTEFLRDPLQVNNPGDWAEEKTRIAGLAQQQKMTPSISADAALKWLEFKGYYRDAAGRPGPWIGFERALGRYNGNKSLHPSGVPHYAWYAREVIRRYDDAKKSQNESK